MTPATVTRRDFLAAALLVPAALVRQARGARFISAVPLASPGGQTPPFGRLLGTGLDARLFTDLSLLGGSASRPQSPVRDPQSSISDSPSASLVTPTDRFFVRTAVPSMLPPTDPWIVSVGGLVRTPVDLNLREWGGSKPTNALSIRFKSGGPWTRVDDCPLPQSTRTWSLWTHTWRPTEPGRYQIVLRVDDRTVRTRRLDIFFYVREIEIDEI